MLRSAAATAAAPPPQPQPLPARPSEQRRRPPLWGPSPGTTWSSRPAAPRRSSPTCRASPRTSSPACLTTPLKVALRCAAQRRCLVLPPAFQAFTGLPAGAEGGPALATGRAELDTHVRHGHQSRCSARPLCVVLPTFCRTCPAPPRLQWTVLPRPLFVQLYRQDFLGSNLFRNFCSRTGSCAPSAACPGSHPALRARTTTRSGPAWDYAVDAMLAQLPSLTGFSSGDLLRMAALGLAPDVSRLGGAAWGDMVPPQLQPPPEVAALPVPPLLRAVAAAAVVVRRARGGGGRRAPWPARLLRREGSLAGTLTPFDLSALPTGPLTLPLPSPPRRRGERLAILRRRLQGVVSATAMGPRRASRPSALRPSDPRPFRWAGCVRAVWRWEWRWQHAIRGCPPAPGARADVRP